MYIDGDWEMDGVDDFDDGGSSGGLVAIITISLEFLRNDDDDGDKEGNCVGFSCPSTGGGIRPESVAAGGHCLLSEPVGAKLSPLFATLPLPLSSST